MATLVPMPQLGKSVVEGTVARWLKQEGERVEKLEPLLEVSTNKVDAEILAPAAGVLLKIVVPEGETVEAGTVIAVIGREGEAVPEIPRKVDLHAAEDSVDHPLPGDGSMSEPELIQHQRELLRAFREATKDRTQAEAEAEARRKAARQAADKALRQARQTAKAQLAAAHEAREKAQAALAEAELEHLLTEAQPDPPTPHPDADPAKELARSASVATEASMSIPDIVDAVQQRREAIALWRRRLMTIFAGITVFILAVVGFRRYQDWQAEQRYQATATAVAAAQAAATALAQATATAVAKVPAPLRPLAERFGMAFVYVPPGEFTMGSPEGEGGVNEHPQHTVYLDGFWIGLTEVTNAQYRPFIEAGGYRQRALWTEAGWSWREDNDVTEPGCWDDEKWNQPDHPVVCISWYEAVAYARWLARETGLEVRLPSEAEWEKAARGTDGRRYPWGDEWDAAKANTGEGGPGRTTPVGAYPAGASPYGALDMAGNVWEWTGSLYRDYPYRADDGREELEGSGDRVLRGGSWNFSQRSVRAADRGRFNPDLRRSYLGVRLVVALR